MSGKDLAVSDGLLRELWPQLSETWDEETDGCRFDCGGNKRHGPLSKPLEWRNTPHAPDCIYRRIAEHLG